MVPCVLFVMRVHWWRRAFTSRKNSWSQIAIRSGHDWLRMHWVCHRTSSCLLPQTVCWSRSELQQQYNCNLELKQQAPRCQHALMCPPIMIMIRGFCQKVRSYGQKPCKMMLVELSFKFKQLIKDGLVKFVRFQEQLHLANCNKLVLEIQDIPNWHLTSG